jgi:hypothetical protein
MSIGLVEILPDAFGVSFVEKYHAALKETAFLCIYGNLCCYNSVWNYFYRRTDQKGSVL